MREDEARRIELVRAIELEDREKGLLTREDREQANHYARTASGSLQGAKFERTYLAARADFAATRLLSRHKGLVDLLGRSRWPSWLGFVVPLVALGAGFLANEFGTGKRMDLLAVPLLGIIAWNVLVYVWILVGAASRLGTKRHQLADPLTAVLARIGSLRRGSSDGSTAINRAAATFRTRWAEMTASINAARAGRTLHLGAALFALGLIGGIYLRALVIEYRAGWESTFLGPEAVHIVLSLLLGPASMLSGVAIPASPEIAAMRWTESETGGVNAAPWIHLYTLTITGLVIVPRLLLALLKGLSVLRLLRKLPVAGREDFYIRRILRASGASPGRARVTPYAYHPGEETRRRLAEVLKAVLGDAAEVRFDEPVEYGAEEDWVAAHDPNAEDDYHLLFFTLASTPEAENHGKLTQALGEKNRERSKGQIMGALVDESPYRAHFAGQAGLDERVETRMAGWRSTFAPAGILPVGVDLSNAASDILAKRIEAHLVPNVEQR